MNEALYILDEAKQVHMLIHKCDESGEFECIHQIDFSKHDLSKVIDDDWSSACINIKAVIYKEFVFQGPYDHEMKDQPKKFAWHESKQKKNEDLPGLKPEPLPMIHVQNVEEMSLMLAIVD